MLTVVTGPPAAGKTTYVRQHANPGDVVIDFDALAVALGSPDTHDHPAHITRVAQAAWHAALRTALSTAAHVWLIHANPNGRDLARYRAMRAEIVTVDPGHDVVAQRIATQRPARAVAQAANYYAGHKSAGRAGHRWRTIKTEFKARCRAVDASCWLCDGKLGPIDYDAEPNEPLGFEADHYHPVSTHPNLANDPTNLRPSHVTCNRTRRNAPAPEPSPQQPKAWKKSSF